MNYRLTIQYDGTRYDGWQRQGNTDETIQGKLEEALFQATGERAELHGAGRTDAGVHALGQVASVRLEHAVPPEELRQALNRLLPDDIAVAAAEEAGARFHARLNAAGKTYRYSIRLGATPDVFRRRFQLHLDEELDLEAMEQAARLPHRAARLPLLLRKQEDEKILHPHSGLHRPAPEGGRSHPHLPRGRVPLPYGAHPGGDAAGGGPGGALPGGDAAPSWPPGTAPPPEPPPPPGASPWWRWTTTDSNTMRPRTLGSGGAVSFQLRS